LNTTFAYDVTNKLTSRTLPNGVVSTYQYEGLDRITVSLGDLASIAGCSTFQLIRFTKSHWGETPFRRLTRLRMERARELLRHTDVSIINISLECGYGNPAHFATAFRRSVGMSPSRYRAG